MMQRVGRLRNTPEEQEREDKGLCTICGKPRPKRRKHCCSDECSRKWWYSHDWSWMRSKILKRDNFKCSQCGFQIKPQSYYYIVVNDPNSVATSDKEYSVIQSYGLPDVMGYVAVPLVVDHIKPIALGGGEFDESNLQILCKWCNKVKTKTDIGVIAETRRDEKAFVEIAIFAKKHHSLMEYG